MGFLGLEERKPNKVVYEKYVADDGSRRRRKKFTEWEQLMGNVEDSETDPDEPRDLGDYEVIDPLDLFDSESIVHTVTYSRIAVRQTPSLDGKVLDMREKGA